MIIFGIKFWAWSAGRTEFAAHCSKCGFQGNFILKKGMRFLTFYWILPTIPVSGIKQLMQCPNCGTRYELPQPGTGGNAPQPPIAAP
jgi:hypothetical protein